ncbi:TonB-dependent receptor [Pseudocolwellia agarivorans]|uniref:TonB-dependent receptor n=1 Tax=Pseudocolwellia agarivorans TaxID=1911682 RepID=UPI001FE4021D|nr:TonB-dependent receptor [Pseudocolwellia agarivorans]
MTFIKKSTMAFKLSCCTLGMLAIPQTFAQTISGKVVNTAGKPSINSQIVLGHSNKKVFTDNQGYFEISGLDAGEYELHIVAKNYSHFNQHVSVGDNDLSGLLYTLKPSVMENIDVYATPLHSSSIESALPINVLSSDELRLKQASTLGETLKGELGVHSSYFGPVSSSPIIRGLDGPRVMVTQNGLDVSDASRVGPDHAVSSEASTATQIEVLRGPATLFYGSGAIGGVVNVVDNRVPTSIDNQVDYLVKHNDVSDENEASFNVNSGVELDNDTALAFHVDAFYRESNDYKIPLTALEHDEHEEHEEHEGETEEEHEEHEELTDTLENSSSRAKGYNAGVSYLMDNGFIGFSYGYLDRKYGLPGHEHHHEDEHEEDHDEAEHDAHEEEQVYSILEQDRYQILSDLTFDNDVFHRVATKIAYTDYIHQEIEDGAPGTTFKNKMFETRFDLYHKPLNDWKGAFTLHYKKSDFEAIGEEAFTPPSKTAMTALAWLEEKHFDQFLVQAGIRLEHVSLKAELTDESENFIHLNNDMKDQSFTPLSSSLGVVWNFTPGYNLGLSLGYSQRAPSASEVFSNGPHIGTSTYELGALYKIDEATEQVVLSDKDVELESSLSFDVTFRKFEGDLGFVMSAFYNRIDDYYFQRNTGFTSEIFEDEEEHNEADHEHEEESFLPIYAYEQSDVDLYGLESELIYQVSSNFTAKIFGDYIRAKLTQGDNLPRIPPLRIGSEFNYTGENFSASLTAQRYFSQNKVANNETSTAGYTMVDANVNYYIDNIGDDFVVFLKVDNITDVDARVHSSFLKDVAPLPAKGVSLGVRGSF